MQSLATTGGLVKGTFSRNVQGGSTPTKNAQ